MRLIRKYWAPALVILLIPLLVTLAFFQLYWINQIGERERGRLEQGLLGSAEQLSMALQNEIGILQAHFVLEHDDIGHQLASGDWEEFRKRWELWRSYALDPSLVSGFYLLKDESGKARLWDWDREGGRFIPSTDDSMARAFDETLRKGSGSLPEWNSVKLPGGTEAIVVSLEREKGYSLAIRIDPAFLSSRLIPLLAQRYLSLTSEYSYRIIDQETGTEIYHSDRDATEADFRHSDLRFPLLFQFPPNPAVGRPGLRGPGGRERRNHPAEPDIDRQLPPLDQPAVVRPENGGDFPHFIPKLPKDDRIGESRWVLEAVHHSGSLFSAVRSGTLWSAVLSLGILAILGTALVALALAVRRATSLADRQHEFIASVTHELKTPIAVIRAAADNLADGLVSTPEQLNRYGLAIRKESHRLGDMIDRLLSYARIKPQNPRDIQLIDLKQLIERVLARYQEEISEARFTVEKDLEKEVFILGDEAGLELVFGNLITNALKHAHEGAWLGITLKSGGAATAGRKREASVTISDRGKGIPASERKKIFEAFYRGKAAADAQISGSGLGLNIASRILTAQGGTIKLESKTGQGATFRIYLTQENLDA